MTRLEDAPPRVYRTIVASVVAYFLLLGYAAYSGDAVAELVAHVLFGIITIGIGALLYSQSSRELEAITAAATFLVTGGVTQLLWIATGLQVLDGIASLTVFAGVALYLYAVWLQ